MKPLLDDECPVCLEPTSAFVLGSNCKHPLCESCGMRWFKVRLECPTCRQVPKLLMTPAKKTFYKFIPHSTNSFGGKAHLGISVQSTCRGEVFVKDTAPGSISRRAGIRKGDVIEGINGVEVRSASTAAQVIQSAQAQELAILVKVRYVPMHRRSWTLLSGNMLDRRPVEALPPPPHPPLPRPDSPAV